MAEVVWTETALNALDAIADYIALDNHEAACDLIRCVFKKVELLADNPQMGNTPKELKNTAYRRLVIKPVYVYYRTDGEQVIIIHVERNERDFRKSMLSK